MEALVLRPPSSIGLVLLVGLWLTLAVGLVGRDSPSPAPSAVPAVVAEGARVAGAAPAPTTASSARGGNGVVATFPAQVPAGVEVDDASGDVRFSASAPMLSTPALFPAVDITHFAAWIADGILHAEVVMAGPAPDPSSPGVLVRLSVGQMGTWLEAPVCTSGPLCGTPGDVPPFAASVTRWADRWAVEYAIPLEVVAEGLGEGPPPGDGYAVLATSSAIVEGGYWTDVAPDEGILLTVSGTE